MFELLKKEDLRKKVKSKRGRYGYLKEKILILAPWIYEQLECSKNRRITVKARDVAKELNLENKADTTIYAGLRFLLYFEGIDVGIRNNGNENLFEMKKLEGGEGFPQSIINTFDNLELDGWYIKRDNNDLKFKHSLKKEYNNENKVNIYILESEGDIYFDRRNFTEEQALQFVKFMSSKDMRAPDVVYNTPINIVLNDKYLDNRGYFDIEFDLDKIGREFRIVRSENCEDGGSEFIATSIYGKECSVYEYDVDGVIKGCSIFSIMRNFNSALMVEKVPERIEILKKIMPELKIPKKNNKNIALIEGKRLIICNSIGTFHLSLVDGTLHKIYGDWKEEVEKIEKKIIGRGTKYICVGPIYNGKENLIIFNGKRYDVDRTTGAIIAKMIMLLEEKYPDKLTESQVKF